MSFEVAVPRGVDRSRRALVIAVGDIAVIGVIIVAGMLHHYINPITELVHTIQVAAPFLIAWLVVAPLVGAYSRRSVTEMPMSIRTATVAWVLATLLGSVLRATPYFPGGAQLSFVGVMVGFGAIGIVAWRTVVGLATRQ